MPGAECDAPIPGVHAVKDPGIKNLPASIHQKLLNNARKTNRPFFEVLQYFAIERFLYRLSKSPYADKFVLKGALMFSVWKPGLPRPTKDIDFLGRTNNDLNAIVRIMKGICSIKAGSDGLVFTPGSVAGERITEHSDYQGVRVYFWAGLGKARVSMQVDVGFGDIVVPGAQNISYPAILDMPEPVLKGYSRESVIAEKLEAMIKLDIINSRMKDFFDVWLLARQFDFKGATLAKAIKETFRHRKTAIIKEPHMLADDFKTDKTKQAQWRAFLRKNKLTVAPADFAEVVSGIAGFVKPVLSALADGKDFPAVWKAAGSWKNAP